MTEKQYMRLRFLKEYLEQIETLKKTHAISVDDYRSEIKWLEARITELENEVFPEVKPLRESPEMRSMRESAEDFFNYTEGVINVRKR
jgi:hypothetical protein